MSGGSKALGAPLLRAIREAWLRLVIEQREADPVIVGLGLVGSLGRGDADDWSDVDLFLVVADDQIDRYADPSRLPRPEQLVLSLDARHNVPRGARSVGVHYVIDALPLSADVYVYPLSQGAWVADATVVVDRVGLPRLRDSFQEHLERRECQPPSANLEGAHRLLQIALIPAAAKRIARGSADAVRMVELVGGPFAPAATPTEQLEALRQLLVRYRDGAPEASLDATSNYLDLVSERLQGPMRRAATQRSRSGSSGRRTDPRSARRRHAIPDSASRTTRPPR
ncbi:MAG: nucleotidyltransferase domain-containing protein [Acidimicrobiales bacterium]